MPTTCKLTIALVLAVLIANPAKAWDRWHNYTSNGIRVDYSQTTDIDSGAFLTVKKRRLELAELFIVTGDRFICQDVKITLKIDGELIPAKGDVLGNRFSILLTTEFDWLEILKSGQKLMVHTKDSCDTETTSNFDISNPIFVRSAPTN